ncbi:D-glycero-beta-D-manno-heptose 1-phosphate adenylyltransferase [Cellulomonas endophytica]|uniref:D-glycero-beta-D-manno-heptose 1-phosphate adenylyltransferase n=1 Tax=Cellulomonas endophytica TaxID=2494735 RepID=UPI001F0C3A38|nr:D-glycero-beta-D-manno-heptose 1-phosphate adenylyltransferase [Cellulomonas endophytica]
MPGSPITPELVQEVLGVAPHVTVVGDLALDGWWTGRAQRISREAPAPVVEVTRRTHAPGQAANTAANLAALGARVRLVGVVGDDPDGRELLALLRAAGVDVTGVVVDGPITPAKKRVVAGDQVLVRIDEVREEPWPAAALEAVAARVGPALAGADALLVCDYGAGMLTGPVRAALEVARPGVRTVAVDAHDLAPWADLRPDVVTPNAAEAELLLGVPLGDAGTGDQVERPAGGPADPGGDRVDEVVRAGAALLAASGAAAAVVTLDVAGTVTLEPGHPPHRTYAEPASEAQASGAGDTFVAALTLARAAGLPLAVAADLAQAAADVVVHRPGTSVCTAEQLLDRWQRRRGALPAHELVARLADERAQGRRIVFTNGCFDVLHRGHTTSLEQAARLGDVLVVAVNGDDSVARLKGPGRPINPAEDRAAVLAALACVDYVTVFDTDTPIPLLEEIRPDVYAKGGDYTPEMLAEAGVVRAYGGELRMLDYVADRSTTLMVERIREVGGTVPTARPAGVAGGPAAPGAPGSGGGSIVADVPAGRAAAGATAGEPRATAPATRGDRGGDAAGPTPRSR